MPHRLQNRTALITGASSGIGRATALLFAAEGAKVACADLQPGTWRERESDETDGPTHERIQKNGGQSIFVKCDVTRAEEVEGAVGRVVEEWGRLDIMVNNAGFALESRNPAPIWDIPLDLFHRTMEANVHGVYYGVKYASRQMITQEPLASGDRGWILNAASVFGLVGSENVSAYCTSKGAVANLTRAAALDCAPYRIHVNAVNPGYTATHMTDPAFADETMKNAAASLHPFRGVGRPEDLAKVYVFLASDDAGWISGVNLPVDGAYTAR